MKRLSDYVDGQTDLPPTPSLKKGVLVDIRLTREIEKWYGRITRIVMSSYCLYVVITHTYSFVRALICTRNTSRSKVYNLKRLNG